MSVLTPEHSEREAKAKARKAAQAKLNESVRRGLSHEEAFVRYLARLDKAGCELTIPLGWYVDNVITRFPPPPSPWHKVIESFRARKRDDPAWFANIQGQVAREDRAERT